MVHKSSGQIDLASSLIVNNPKLNRRLDKIQKLVDWTAIESILSPIYSATTGRPSFPLLVLFKCLLLQNWHSLSDYALEETLDDRLSFRRFVGLCVTEKAPDHSTICRFRDQLTTHKLQNKIFKELDRQLQKCGLIVKKGTLVDATVIESAAKTPSQGKDGKGGKSEIDKDAKWTKKAGKYHFGYKAHLGVDQGSELIRRVEVTPANIHDGHMLESAICGDEEWVFADKAYDSQQNDELLKRKGLNNGILLKRTSKKEKVPFLKECNKILSVLRVPVERVFGTLKKHYGGGRAKYHGVAKNHLHIVIKSICYNLRRMEKLCV